MQENSVLHFLNKSKNVELDLIWEERLKNSVITMKSKLRQESWMLTAGRCEDSCSRYGPSRRQKNGDVE